MTYQIGNYYYVESEFNPKDSKDKLPKGQVWCKSYYEFAPDDLRFMGEGPLNRDHLEEKGKIVAGWVLP